MLGLATLITTGAGAGDAAGSTLSSLIGAAIAVGLPIGAAVFGIVLGFRCFRRGAKSRAAGSLPERYLEDPRGFGASEPLVRVGRYGWKRMR